MTVAQESKVFPLRLSHSSLEVLQSCERKFQLEKLLQGNDEKQESVHFSFGHGFGAGVATYMVTQDKDKAIYEAWMAYEPVVEDDKKNQATCIAALLSSFNALDGLLKLYEVASFKDSPAIELSFKLNINPSKYFVGHIDVVLRHRITGRYYVMEIKSTSMQLLDLKPLYQHSGQALGYSIALDAIVGEKQSEYGVLYFVIQLPTSSAKEQRATPHILEFKKTLLDRLNWFVSLGLDVQHLEAMEQIGIFPKRFSACVRFNRACHHFGTCSLQNFDVPKVIEEDTKVYTFTYELEDLIVEHMNRIATMPPPAPTMNIMDLDAPF
jgi:hypothetical protein